MQFGSGNQKNHKMPWKVDLGGCWLHLDGVWDGLGPFLGTLGPPSGSQVDYFGLPGPSPKHPKFNLLPKMLPKRLPRSPGARFWSSRGLIFELPSSILKPPVLDFNVSAAVTQKVHVKTLNYSSMCAAFKIANTIIKLPPLRLQFTLQRLTPFVKIANSMYPCDHKDVLPEWRPSNNRLSNAVSIG